MTKEWLAEREPYGNGWRVLEVQKRGFKALFGGLSEDNAKAIAASRVDMAEVEKLRADNAALREALEQLAVYSEKQAIKAKKRMFLADCRGLTEHGGELENRNDAYSDMTKRIRAAALLKGDGS